VIIDHPLKFETKQEFIPPVKTNSPPIGGLLNGSID
jgi:hypothetical protein